MEDCSVCDPGSYCAEEGLSKPQGLCQASYYCPSGSMSSLGETLSNQSHICPSGFFCPLGSQPILCPPGHACPKGSTTPINCNLGYYQDNAGQSACALCPPGSYCQDINGTVAPVVCSSGAACPAGSSYVRKLNTLINTNLMYLWL